MTTMKRTYSIPSTDLVGIAPTQPLAFSLTKQAASDDYEVDDEQLILSKERKEEDDAPAADSWANGLW